MTNGNNGPLMGKVALVTGASHNIGLNAARALASMGATLAVHYHSDSSKESINSFTAEIASAGSHASVFQADLTQPSQVKKLFDFTEEKLGKIDIIINTAGTMLKSSLLESSLHDYDTLFNIHSKAVFLILKQAANRLQNNGRIVNISTSLTAVQRGPGYSVYSAAKAAAEQLVKIFAEEVAHWDITVNSVSPGPIDNSFLHSAETTESLEFLKKLSVFNRLGTNNDITPVLRFLASKEAQWITGQNIRVNGGMA